MRTLDNAKPVKTRRIARGEYEGTYRGVPFRVISYARYGDSRGNKLWNIMVREQCDDNEDSKATAILAAMDRIDKELDG